jgi:uncharacterized membrane protein (Fun14 family)
VRAAIDHALAVTDFTALGASVRYTATRAAHHCFFTGVTTQITAGGVAGFCAGYVVKKSLKVAALGIGAAVIVYQVRLM